MKIVKITLYTYERSFKIPFISSHMNRTNPESVIISVDFDNGIQGFGESAPRQYVTGEDCASVINLISGLFTRQLLDIDIHGFNDVIEVLAMLEEQCKIRGITQYNSALGAIDIALIDALGKIEARHSSEYLGPVLHDRLYYSISIPFIDFKIIEKVYSQISHITFQSLKILINDDRNSNSERIAQLRSLFGPEIDMRLEANGMLSYESALANCVKLQKYGITAIEQPVERYDHRGMARFRQQAGIPVIADESVCSLEDTKRLIDEGSCDIINIKLSKCGGLIRSQEIYDYARSRGIQCQMGAHVGESTVLSEAGRAFALTSPALEYIEGCSFLLFQNLSNSRQFYIDGDIVGSGLGIDKIERSMLVRDLRKLETIAS